MPTCPLALHALSPKGLSISSPSQGAAAAQPRPLAGDVQGSGESLRRKSWSKILIPVSASPLEGTSSGRQISEKAGSNPDMLDLTLLSRRGSCKCSLRWDCKWDSHSFNRDPGQKLL